jgi:ABC-type transporter Mla subunit MlaD
MFNFADIAQAITSPAANAIISGSILLLAVLVFLIYFRPQCGRLHAHIRAANLRLLQIRESTEFANSFEEFTASIAKNPLLGEEWQRYEGTLIFPAHGELPQLIKSSTDPDAHFNSETLIAPRINLRFYQAFPNYLTGIGILGTFVGLVAGIYLASAGLTNPDIDQVKEALKKLLSGASLAFLTSISGLVGSLAFSFLEKRSLFALVNSIGNWNRQLAKLVRRVTPEQLAARQIEEAARQSLQLERFNTDLAVSIAEALNTKLSTNFSPFLTQVLGRLDTLASAQADNQKEVLSRIIERFQETMNDVAGKELVEFKQSFGDLNTGIQESIRTLSEGQAKLLDTTNEITSAIGKSLAENTDLIHTRFSDSVNAVADRLQSAGSAASENIRKSGEGAAELLNQASGELHASMKGLNEIIIQNQNLFKDHESQLREIRGVIESIKSAQGAFEAVGRPIEASLTIMRQSLKEMTEGQKAVTSLVEGVHATLTQANEVEQATMQAWSSYESRISGLDKALSDSFTEINRGVSSYTEQVKSFVTGLDKDFQTALGTLSSVINELHESVEELTETFEAQRA